MNDQLIQLINDKIKNLRSFFNARIGAIELPNGKIFLQPGESGFRRSVFDRIAFIDDCFGEQGIPENLQELIVAQVVQQVLEASPPYLNAKKDLSYTQQRDLDHGLTLFFTQDTHLRSLRLKLSHEDLGDCRPSYNHQFHGEFSYALLHILNLHSLHVGPEYKDLLFNIATTMSHEFCIHAKEGMHLGWRDATPYGVDTQLSKRKQDFCSGIDEKQPLAHFDPNVMFEKEYLEAPVTLAIWNRNAPANRDPERRLGLNLVKHIVMHSQEQIAGRTLRLLIIGDQGGLPGLEAWAAEHEMLCHDHRGEHMWNRGSPKRTPALPKDEQLYRVRKIMKKFNPSLIVGSRSGLMALCSLVGCAGLQIDTAADSNTKISSRATRKPHTASTSALEVTVKNDDQRLLEVFARCPNDGLGPHLKLAMSTANTDKATLTPSSLPILNSTISAMLVDHPDFKPLMLETLASYLSGDAEALQKLRHLLDTYQTYNASLKEQAEAQAKPGSHASSEYKRDDHDTGGGSSPDSDKKSGGDSSPDDRSKDGRSSPPDESKPSGHEPTTSHHRGHQRSAMTMMLAEPLSCDYNYDDKEITMNSKLFFEGFKTDAVSEVKCNTQGF